MTVELALIEASHEQATCLVLRPKDNTAFITPDSDSTTDLILRAIQEAMDKIAPVLPNCKPLGPGSGNLLCVAYVKVDPLPGDVRPELCRRICGHTELVLDGGSYDITETHPFKVALKRTFDPKAIIPINVRAEAVSA